MVYEKYIKRGGKLYGPYLYKSVKKNGKVITEYLGPAPEKRKFSFLSKKNFYFFLGFISLLFLGVFLFQLSPTGNVALLVDESYSEGDNIEGIFRLTLEEGDFIPADTNVLINNSGNFSSYILSELVNVETTNGDFFVAGLDINGSGEGYGYSEDYPEVDFVLRIISEEESGGDVGEEEEENETEEEFEEEINESEVENESEENETEIEEEQEEESEEAEEESEEQEEAEESEESVEEEEIEDEIEEVEEQEESEEEQEEESEEAEEESEEQEEAEEEQEQGAEESEEEDGEEEAEEQEADEESEENSEGNDNSGRGNNNAGGNENSGSSSGSGSSSSSSGNGGGNDNSGRGNNNAGGNGNGGGSPITGEVVLEDNLIQGSVRYGEVFVYDLEEGESVEIVEASAEVEINIENGIVNITTEYTGEDNELEIDLSELGLVAQEGILEIKLVYEDIEILSIEEEISFEEIEENESLDNESLEIIPGDLNFSLNGSLEDYGNFTISTVQEQVVINRPVKWKKRVNVSQRVNVSVSLPADAENISVYKIVDLGKEKVEHIEKDVSEDELNLEEDEFRVYITAEVISGENRSGKGFVERIWEGVKGAITGRVIEVENATTNKTVKIDYKTLEEENASEFEIEYDTPGPYSVENVLNGQDGKEVKIVSKSHYNDVLAYTILENGAGKNIRIYWVENDSYLPVSYSEEYLGDKYIEWIIPHLSNQTFNITFFGSTLEDESLASGNNVEVWVNATGIDYMEEFVWNWNGTNYTIMNDSLVLMYNFDNQSILGENDTLIVDLSGNGNNGTGYGNATPTSDGKYNGAWEFDGDGDWIEMDAPEGLSVNKGSISVWFNKHNSYSSSSRSTLVSFYTSFSNDYITLSLQDWNNNYEVEVGLGATSFIGNEFYNIPKDANWHHVVMMWNETNVSVYVDGDFKKIDDYDDTDFDTVQPGYIGKHSDGSTLYMNGTIDEVRVWNRTLSAEEVSIMYMSNLRKYDTDKWEFYINQSKNATAGLDNGTYTYQAFARNNQTWNSTEERVVYIGEAPSSQLSGTQLDNCTAINESGVYLLNDSILSETMSKCFDIDVSDVIFDCQGHTIQGNDIADYAFYTYATLSNVTIRNCILEHWDLYAIYDRYGDLTLENLTIRDNPDSGMFLYNSDGTNLTNCNISDNADYGIYNYFTANIKINNTIISGNNRDIYWVSSSSTDCASYDFDNVTDDRGYEHLFIGSNSGETEIKNRNNISSINVCGKDNFVIDNISFSDYDGDGYAIFTGNLNNISITNITVEGYRLGLHVYDTDDSYFENINTTNTYYGLDMDDGSSGNLMTKSYFEGTGEMVILAGNNNNFSYNNIISNFNEGVDAINSVGNRFFYNNISAPSGVCVRLYYVSSNNTFYNNIFENCGESAIHLDESGSNEPVYNLFYNNLFNASGSNGNMNVDAGMVAPNYMNTSEQTGDNIYDDNPNICGNFWIGVEGNGYDSLNCTDSDTDGFCDDPFVMNFTVNSGAEVIDYCPLSDKYSGAVGDTTDPEVTLNSPDADATLDSNPVTFNCTVSDNINLSNVTLYINGVANETNNSGVNNSNYIFEVNLSDGNYNWTCQGVDNESNGYNASVRNFEVDVYKTIVGPPENETTSDYNLTGSVSGNMSYGGEYSGVQYINFTHSTYGVRLRIAANFSNSDVNLTELVIEASDSKTAINLSGVTGVINHSIYIPNVYNEGVYVCPEADKLGDVNNSCENVTSFVYSEALSGTWRNGTYITIEGDYYRIDNLTGSGGGDDGANPRISVSYPTNDTLTTNTSVEINVSINESTLEDFVWNWNGTNYTLFNDSLVLMMNFDNVSALGENDTLVVDLSGGGNNGTGYGNATPTSDGKYNGAWEFDGDDDSIDFSSSISYGINSTESFWIKYYSLVGNPKLFGEADNTFDYHISYSGGDYIYIVGSEISNPISYTPSVGVWQHFVFKRSENIVSLYVDGNFITNATGSFGSTQNQFDKIGAESDGANTGTLNGSIDEVRIYNRSLSEEEIAILYMSNLRKYDIDKWEFYINQSKNATAGLDLGDYTYIAYAKDNASNWNDTGVRSITISEPDTTKPNLTIISPTAQNYTSASIWFNVSANDTVEMDDCWFNIGNGANTTMSNDGDDIYYYENSSVANGNYTAYFFCNDTSGNVNDTESVDFNVSVAGDVFNLNITQPENDTLSSNNSVEIKVNITNADEFNDFVWNWNGTNYTLFNDSLILMMNFDNDSDIGEDDSLAVDVSGYFNNGSISGASLDADGKYEKCYSFDAANERIEIDNDEDFNFSRNGGDYSIAAWIYPSSSVSGDEYAVVDNSQAASSGFRFFVNLGAIKIIHDFAFASNGPEGGSITSNSWQFVVASVNGSYGKVYVDGVEADSASNLDSFAQGDGDISIGDHPSTSGSSMSPFPGKIDEVRIYNRSLSSEEIQILYMSNLRKYDTDKWEFYINQSKNATDGLDDGNYTFMSYATNSSLWENSGEYWIEFDTTNPDVFIGKNATSLINNASININWSSSDVNLDITIFNVSFPNGTVLFESSLSSGEVNLTSDNLTENGVYNIELWANDSLSNFNYTSDSFVVGDEIPPNMSIISPLSQNYTDLQIWFNVSVNDSGELSECWYNLNNGANASMSNDGDDIYYDYNSSVPEGIYTAYFFCNDTAENVNDSLTRDFEIAIQDIGLELIFPSGDFNATKNEWFNMSFNVSCYDYDCGNVSIDVGPNELLDEESFESDFGNWENVGGDDFDWTRNSGATSSGGTGPSSAYDGSYYVYVETSDTAVGAFTAGEENILQYNMSGTTYGYVDFYYHQDGIEQGTLYLEGYDGSDWNYIWNTTGDNGASWLHAGIDDTAFYGYTKLRFRNVAAGGYRGDVALDLIKVYEKLVWTSSDQPFITNESSNPFNVSLTEDETKEVVFWVNATGSLNSVHEFQVYANLTSNTSRSNFSDAFNVTIVGTELTLNSPANGTSEDTNITFNCSVESDKTISNVTFYWNYSGTWVENGTEDINAESGTASFVRDNLALKNGVIWNCKAINDDSEEKWADDNYTFDIQPVGWLNISLHYPDTDISIEQNSSFRINSTISCEGISGAECGDVYANVRYNESSVTPNTLINYTSGASPFYIINSSAWESGVSEEWNAIESNGNTAYGIAVDSDGNVYVTGFNGSSSYDYYTIKYNASTGEEIWNITDTNGQYAEGIAADSNGGVYVTGYSFDGVGNYYTIKYNASTGEEIWNTTDTDGNIAYGIAADSNGGVYVTGDGGVTNYYTIKYNASTGEEIWNTTDTDGNIAYGIAADSNGGVYITGKNEFNDYYTIKYNASTGEEIWNTTDTDGNIAYGIAADSNGGVYVTGDGGVTNYYTIKYNASTGEEIWNTTDSNGYYAYGIAADSNGGVYVTGYTLETDYYTIKYNASTGEEIWNTTDSNGNRAYGIDVDSSGNVYITGYDDSNDYYTIKYSQIKNPLRKSLSQGESWDVEWWVNATGTQGEGWFVDVLANSSYSISDANISDNETVDRLVTISEYSVSLNSPANGTSEDTNITFNCTASDTSGSIVNVTFYWNYSGTWVENGTEDINAESGTASFVRDNLALKNGVIWNCKAINDDSEEKWADDNYTFDIQPVGWLNISLHYPDTDISIEQNSSFRINSTISCEGISGAECGQVYANVRYNESSVTPNTLINYTTGGNPFYIINSSAWESGVSEEWSVTDSDGFIAHGIDVDLEGNVYVTGYDDSEDYYTIKYNGTDGTEIWNTTDSIGLSAHGIDVDLEGNVYVTGYNGTLIGDKNYYTIKYNASTGEEIWNVSDSTGFVARGIDVDLEGNVYVTGYDGSNDYYTIKYNGTDGTEIWNTTDSTGYRAYGIAVDSDGNVYVTGEDESNDYYTIKYNGTDGTEIWNTTDSTGYRAYGIAVDSDGNVYVTGEDESNDYYTIKYNASSGEEIWNTTDSTGYRAYGIAVDSNGGVYVTGYNFSGPSYDYYTIKYNASSGEEIWNTTDSNGYEANGIAVDLEGNIYVTGYDDSYDYYTIKYSQIKNPLRKSLSQGESWDVEWWINATGTQGEGWFVDVLANSSYSISDESISDNETVDRLVSVNAAPDINAPTVALISPLDSSSVASNLTGFVANFTDATAIANATLYVWNSSGIEINSTIENVTGTSNQTNISVTLPYIDTFEWNYYVCDSLGYCGWNSTGNFSVTYQPVGWLNISLHYPDTDISLEQNSSFRINSTISCEGISGAECGDVYANVRYNVSSAVPNTLINYTSGSSPFYIINSSAWESGVSEVWNATDSNGKYAEGIAVDSNGGVYITGYNGSNPYDYFTIKYNGTDGTEIWNVTDANGFIAYGIAVDSSGGVYVTGYNGSYYYYTIKYNGTDGTEIWNTTDSNGDISNGIAVDSNGNVYVTGYNTTDFISTDYYTIKYNGTDGTEIWNVTDTNGKSGRGIAVDSNGNVYVTGNDDSEDYYTIKYNGTDGTEIWNTTDSNGLYAKGIAVDSNGGVYVTGYNGSNPYDYFTIKYNGTDGTEIWNATSSNGYLSKGIAVDSNGNVYVTGYDGSNDYYTIKYNGTDGTEIWNTTDNNGNAANGIAVDSNGGVYVTGYNGSNPYNYYTIKYSQIQNPLRKSLSQGESWDVEWWVNATGTQGEGWFVDVLVNSSYSVGDESISDNETVDRLVSVNAAPVSSIGLDVIYPESDLNATQYEMTNITLNVSCLNADCGEVNVSLNLVPKTSIYDFSDLSNKQAWYDDSGSDVPKSPGDATYSEWNDSSGGCSFDYSNIAEDDNNRDSDDGSTSSHLNLWFNFSISESVDYISDLEVKFVGYDTLAGGDDFEFDIWNFSSSSWEVINTTSSGESSDVDYGVVFNSDFNNLIQNGQLHLGVSGAYTAGGRCLSENSNILTSEGYKSIDSIELGDVVYSYDSGKLVLDSVIDVGVKDISDYGSKFYEIVFENGSVNSTYQHLFYVNGDYVFAKDLNVGDYLFDSNNEYREILEINIIENVSGDVWYLTTSENNNFFVEGVLSKDYNEVSMGPAIFIGNYFQGNVLEKYVSKDLENYDFLRLHKLDWRNPEFIIRNELKEVEYIDYLRLNVTYINLSDGSEFSVVKNVLNFGDYFEEVDGNYFVLEEGDKIDIRFENLGIEGAKILSSDLIVYGYYEKLEGWKPGYNEHNTMYINYVEVIVTESGLISTNTSFTPFYTNVSNPYNISLSEGQSQEVIFWINATGNIGEIYEFYADANLTSNSSIGNSSRMWNTTITGFEVDLNSPANGAVEDTNITFNCTAIGTSSEIISNVTFYWNYSGSWVENGTEDINADSGTAIFVRDNLAEKNGVIWNCKAINDDSEEKWADDNYTFDIQPVGWLNISLHYPDTDISIEQNSSFRINSTISCEGISGAECGDVYANVRYNESSVTPNTLINYTSGASPFYIINSSAWESGVSEVWNSTDSNGYRAYGIAVDSSGNVYVTGEDESDNYYTIKYNSSNGEEIWNVTDTNGHRAYGIALDNDGNVYLTGHNNSDNYYTIKYNGTDGTEIWNVSDSTGLSALGIALDNDGNVYVTGYDGSNDYYTIKYNASNGEEIWNTTDSNGYRAYGIALDNDGNVYVTGYDGSTAYYTIKYNASNGEEIWNTTDTNGYSALGIAVDSSGNVYITGRDESLDYYTIKYNASNGEEIWNTTDTNGNYANGIALDNDGNVYVTGYDGSTAYYTIKYNASNGEEIWNTTDTNGNYAYGIDVDSNGGIYVTGWDDSNDYYTIKYSQIKNPLRKSLSQGESWFVEWWINATGTQGEGWFVDVLANSSYSISDANISDNETEDRLVSVNAAPDINAPTVALISPLDSSSVASNLTGFVANFTDATAIANATLYVWNSSGIEINSTIENLTGTSNQTNISVTLPYIDTFEWNYYACDSLGYCGWNSTGNFSVTYQPVGWLNISLHYPDTDISIEQNSSFRINSTISCEGISGAECGDVYANVRYNSSSVTPNTLINYTTGGNPFYIINSSAWESGVSEEWNAIESNGARAYGITVDSNGGVYITGYNGTLMGDRNYYTIKYNASTGEEIWNVSDSNGYTANGITVDSSGNVYVTGYNGSDPYDYYTIKYNASTGEEIWNVTDVNGEDAYGVAIDNEGNVYVTGATDSDDYYTIKYNGTDGTEIWNISDSNGYRASGVVVDSNRGVYVTGYDGSPDYYTIKYNSTDGTEIWNTTDTNGFIADGIAVDSSGGVYIIGHDGSPDYYTIKYNSTDGTEIWNVTGSNGGYGYGIAVDLEGNVYVTGEDVSNNYYTIKYNSTDGTEIWNTTDTNGNTANGIAVDSNGNVYITGYNSDVDYYTIKYSQIKNPLRKSLSQGESWFVEWWVNATGTQGEGWFVDVLANSSYSISDANIGDNETFDRLVMISEDDTNNYIDNCTQITESGTYLLNQSILNSHTTKCMEILSDDVILDCQGHTVDGDNSADYGVYLDPGSQQTYNFTLKNCIFTNWDISSGWIARVNDNVLIDNCSFNDNPDYGLYVYYSDGINLTGITALNNVDEALYFGNSELVKLTNSFFNSSGAQAITLSSDFPNSCNYDFEDVNGTGGKPIVLFNNTAYNIENWDNNASEIILCMADGSKLNNLSFDGGDGIYVSRSANVNITNIDFNDTFLGLNTGSADTFSTNCIVENITCSNVERCLDFGGYSNLLRNILVDGDKGVDGIYSYGFIIRSGDNNIIGNVSISGVDVGVYFYSSASNNTAENLTIDQFSSYAIYLTGESCYDNYVKNVIATNPSTADGINIDARNDIGNTIDNFTCTGCQYGVDLYYKTNNNTIKNSKFLGFTLAGIYFDEAVGSAPSNNTFYNDIFNDSADSTYGYIRTDVVFGENWFNISEQAGDNIYDSNNPNICGNFWENSSGGYSTICEDSENDGFCDDAYVIPDTNNNNWTDYCPLSDEYVPNLAPDIPNVSLVSVDGTNRTGSDLNCSAVINDSDGNDLNVTIRWYRNGELNLTIVDNSSYADGSEIYNILESGNTSKSENWSCSIQLNDGSLESGWGNSSNLTIENTLPSVTLNYPGHDAIITDRTPFFNWTGTDADGDSLTFEFDINSSGGCSDERAIVDVSSAENYTVTNYLKCLWDDNLYYNWSVRASDDAGVTWGNWTDSNGLWIQALLTIELLNDTIEFGSMNISDSDNTTDDNPLPFLLQNQGNCFVDILMNATNLWASVANPTSYYQFRIANKTGHEGAFNSSASNITWGNVPASSEIVIVKLNWSDKNMTEIEILAEVPNDEPPGNKQSTVIFSSSLGE